jgi:hypothetical protein
VGDLVLEKMRAFLSRLAEGYTEPASLFLLGGSALLMLGSPRTTLDVDYVGDDRRPDDLQRTISRVAHELDIEVEPVPIEEFVPVPAGASERCVFVGQFGALSVYVFDPYTIALSKLDRGFETDLADIVFLIRRGFVDLASLETLALDAIAQAREFDLDPAAIRAHLQALRGRL